MTKTQRWSNRKRGALLASTAAALALVGIGAGIANGASTGIPLSGGQSASVTCSGDDLTISPVSPTAVNLNCVASPETTTTEAPTTTTQPSGTTTTQPSGTTTTTTEPPTTTTTSPSGTACIATANGTNQTNGSCFYPDPQPEFTGTVPGSTPEVDTNMWSPVNGATETLTAYSPSLWSVSASIPGLGQNGGVIAYTNSWARDYAGTVDSFPQITQSFTESMPHNAQTTAWAMDDLWFNNWADEVMIQYDFSNNADCDASTVVATNILFGGSNGVPVQQWHLCDFGGGTFAWKLGATEGAGKQSESSGSIDIKAMIGWLETNGYLPAASTWTALSDGWEICSTGGQNQTFSMSNFSVNATS